MNLKKFGRLVNASHVSLEHDYEVTGIELDTLAHTAWKQEGVLGARMTGAGFGGCGIAIVAKDKVDEFTQKCRQGLYRNHWLCASFLHCRNCRWLTCLVSKISKIREEK